MDLRLLSTCPESDRICAREYVRRVRAAARLCEAAGHEAIVIHSENRLFDPWIVAQEVLRATRRLRPVVSVQPLHMHPYATAKKVVTLTRLFGRPPDLNLVAGGRSDLLALDDEASHDDRYRRLTEYGRLVQRLLESSEAVDHCGEFYRLHRPEGIGVVEPDLMPRLMIAGSSTAGDDAARLLGALVVRHPSGVHATRIADGDCVHLGVVARPSAEEAWDVAHARFQLDLGRRLQHRLEMRFSDSQWQQELARAGEGEQQDSPYWLQPFDNRLAQCAYLVGDYRTLSRELRGFLDSGARAFLLDEPASATELRHTTEVFRRAWARFASPLAVSA